VTRRKRWRPPWPIQLVGTAAALVAPALVWTEALRLLGIR
jgi:hypothetical protein